MAPRPLIRLGAVRGRRCVEHEAHTTACRRHMARGAIAPLLDELRALLALSEGLHRGAVGRRPSSAVDREVIASARRVLTKMPADGSSGSGREGEVTHSTRLVRANFRETRTPRMFADISQSVGLTQARSDLSSHKWDHLL